MVDISVIIPCYNRKDSIGRAIDSVLSQSYNGSYEIIVSDDGSKDGSVEFVRTHYASRVIIVEKPISCKDQGASGARNRGISVASGRFICFLDSDDYYLTNFFDVLSSELERDKNLGYVFCAVNQESKIDGRIETRRWTKKRMSKLDKTYHVLYSAHCIWTGCIMIRKECFDTVGDFNLTLSIGEDTDMWLKLSESYNGKYIDKICTVYCVEGFNNNQLTQDKTYDKYRYMSIVLKNSLSRVLHSSKNDRMRLLLIRKTQMLIKLPQNRSFIFSIYRQVIINLYLALRMPLEYMKYLQMKHQY